jgi:excisionase family DNA binding protein
MEKLLKPEELAERLGIKLSTLYNWTYKGNRGKIPFIKVGACLRFRQSDIEKWLSMPTEPKPKIERHERPKGSRKRKKDSYIDSLVEKAKTEALGMSNIC